MASGPSFSKKSFVSEVKEQSDLESEATRENTVSMVSRRVRLGCPRWTKRKDFQIEGRPYKKGQEKHLIEYNCQRHHVIRWVNRAYGRSVVSLSITEPLSFLQALRCQVDILFITRDTRWKKILTKETNSLTWCFLFVISSAISHLVLAVKIPTICQLYHARKAWNQ